MTFTMEDLFIERLNLLFQHLSVIPITNETAIEERIKHIDEAIRVAEQKNELIRRHHLLSEEDGA